MRNKNFNHIGTFVTAPLLIILVFWGFHVIWVEGFSLAGKRNFSGDMFVAMYTDAYWDGQGIFYGPVSVFLKWLVDFNPTFFTIHFFAWLNLLLITISFLALMKTLRLSKIGVLLSLASWVCFSHLYYGFSVAATPEFIELTLLVIAFLAYERKYNNLLWSCITLAILTKITPIIFLPYLFF